MLMLMPKLQVPAVESEAESVTLRTQLMVQKGVHLGVPRAGVFKTSYQLFILVDEESARDDSSDRPLSHKAIYIEAFTDLAGTMSSMMTLPRETGSCERILSYLTVQCELEKLPAQWLRSRQRFIAFPAALRSAEESWTSFADSRADPAGTT